MDETITLKDVARLDIKAGETLLLWVDELPLDPETGEPHKGYLDTIKDALPEGVKVLVLEGNTSFGILSPEQAQAAINATLERIA